MSEQRNSKQQRQPPKHPLPHHLLLLLLLLLLTTKPTPTTSQKNTLPPKKPIAVLHVGPHKTGTTSIQSTTSSYITTLTSDNYIVLDFDKTILNLRQKRHSPAKNIAFCSCPYYADEHSKYCSLAYYNETIELLQKPEDEIFQGMNLLLSHESYDKECIEIETLQNIFEKWDVRIVVGYRRYFDWAVSLYGEDHRVEILPGWEDRAEKFKGGRGQEWDVKKEPYESLKRWLTLHWMEYQYEEGKYTTAIVERYAKVFGREKISIINMHEEGINVVEDFLCDKVPGAPKTCEAFRSAKVHEKNAHVAASNAYDHIAVEAYNAGFVSGEGLSRPEVRELIKEYQEESLGLGVEDFPKDCLEKEELERLLELSIQAEEEIVPEFFALEGVGEQALRERFEEEKTTKLCGVDTEALFQDEKWVKFLNLLEEKDGGNKKVESDKKAKQTDEKGKEDKIKTNEKDKADNKKGDKKTNGKTKGGQKGSGSEVDDNTTTEKDNHKSTSVPLESRAHSTHSTTSKTPTKNQNTNNNDEITEQEQQEERKFWLTLEFASSVVIVLLVIISSSRGKMHRGKKNDGTVALNQRQKMVESHGLLTSRRLDTV